MNKRILVVIVVLAAVIVGAVTVFALTRPSEPTDTPRPAPTAESSDTDNTEPSPEPTSETPVATPGAYVEYSDSAISQAEGTTLLFFHASWCPQCLAIENDIEAEGVPDGVTIIKVDYDSHQDLRQQYGVTLQTTFVEVTADGAEVEKFIAYDTPRLQAVLDAML